MNEVTPRAAPAEPDSGEPGTPGSAHPVSSRGGPRQEKRKTSPPLAGQQAIPPRGVKVPLSRPGLKLPHERDQSTQTTAQAPDPSMVQAKRDLDAGLVDTDMHATPGLDAKRREGMVPGPGGKTPRSAR